MYCKKCGTPLPENGKFCPGCGHAIIEENPKEETIESVNNETFEDPADPYGNPIDESEIKDPYAASEEKSEETNFTEIPIPEAGFTNTEPTENMPPQEEYIPPMTPQNDDPFSGPAHPSVKKNIIIACVVLGIVTVLSIVLMVVGIVKMASSEAFTEDLSGEYSEEIAVDSEKLNNSGIHAAIDPGSSYDVNAGNTHSNVANAGIAVDDGKGGAYYIDVDEILCRTENGNTTSLLYSRKGYYSGLNFANDHLYYLDTIGEKMTLWSYDIRSEAETSLWETTEIIRYCSLWKDEIYLVSEFDITAVNINTKEIRKVYSADNEIFDFYVNEDGIYFALWENGKISKFYHGDHNGLNVSTIAEGYFFRFANDQLYINFSDEYGNETIEVADLDGKNRRTIYSFKDRPNTVIDYFAVEDGLIYCSTITEDFFGNCTYEMMIIDAAGGELYVVDENSDEEENPYYGINIAGNWLFYYDATFNYGTRIFNLSNL